MSTYPYASPTGYGSAAHSSPYGAPAAVPSGGAYSHSPYGAPAPAPAPASNYGAPTQERMHSPYATNTLSPGGGYAPSGGGYHSAAPSPRMGTMGLGGVGATTMTPLPTGGQLTVGPGAASPPQQAQPFAANVQPGTVTYTTTVDEKGRAVYHHFKAENATYTSPQGMTYTGIQWVPIETSYHPQIGVAPAGPDIAAAVRPLIPQGVSPSMGYRDDKAFEKEERRRRKEERKAAERSAAWEAERRAREQAEEEEIIKARERDAMRNSESKRLTRRRSMGTGLGADLSAPTGYARERSRERGADGLRERELRGHVAELEGRMSDMSVGGRAGGYGADPYGAPPVGARSRRNSTVVSPYDEPVGGSPYDRDYDREHDREPAYGATRSRPSSIYGGGGGAQNKRASGIYAEPGVAPGGIYAMPTAERSPRYGGTNALPAAAGGYYPPGHIYEGRPIHAGAAPSSPSLLPGAPYGMGAPSPRMRAGAMPAVSPRLGGGATLAGGYGAPPPASASALDQLLASPDAFSRPINRAQAFTPFSMLKINDLDDFLDEQIAARPAVLGTHDVMPEDWGRFMNDLALGWKGRLPLPAFAGGPPPVRTDLINDLLELWNQQFFIPRHAEIALYRGRHCMSGRQEGSRLPEALVPSFEDSEYSTGESDSDSGLDRHGQGGYGYGGRGGAYEREAKRKAKMEEKVRRAMERKEDFRKGYGLYLHYLPPKEY